MNKDKLIKAIEIFKYYYSDSKDFYNYDERGWKVELSIRFKQLFSKKNFSNTDFVNQLVELINDSKLKQSIILLSGSNYHHIQNFISLLKNEIDRDFFSRIFDKLIFAQEPIKDRINSFKEIMDAYYKRYEIKGTMQLNLISQFLGLTFPNEHYVYKSTEFYNAVRHFEYDKNNKDNSTGGIYEYFLTFLQEIKKVMNESGLNEVDFIDIQTFVFREDWYSPTDFEKEKKEFEDKTEEAYSTSIKN